MWSISFLHGSFCVVFLNRGCTICPPVLHRQPMIFHPKDDLHMVILPYFAIFCHILPYLAMIPSFGSHVFPIFSRSPMIFCRILPVADLPEQAAPPADQWEISRILKWRYCTIFLAIFSGDIPLHRPYIGLIYGRYLQFRFLKWPLSWGCHCGLFGCWPMAGCHDFVGTAGGFFVPGGEKKTSTDSGWWDLAIKHWDLIIRNGDFTRQRWWYHGDTMGYHPER